MSLDDAIERVEADRAAHYSKRRRIREAGYDPDKLELASKLYHQSLGVLNSVAYHQRIVDQYENPTLNPRWEDF